MVVSETLLKRLYNREFKELFLEKYLSDDRTRLSYVVYLARIAKYERKLGRDLCNFNQKQTIKMFSNMKISSHTTMKTLFNICKVYASWTCGKKYNKDYNMPFVYIEYEEDIFPLLDFSELKNKYITEEQLWNIIDNYSLNAQDSICLLLPFYFIKNDKCADLVNLKIENINVSKSIITIGDRDIFVPKRVIEIAIESYNQTIYNRTGEKGHGDRSTCVLSISNFIVRPVSENGVNEFVSAQTCAHRCRKILELAGFKKTSINDINMSGKLHLLLQIKNKENCVLVADYQFVNEMFGHSSANYANVKKLFEIIYENGEHKKAERQYTRKIVKESSIDRLYGDKELET